MILCQFLAIRRIYFECYIALQCSYIKQEGKLEMIKKTFSLRVSDRHMNWLRKQSEKHEMSNGEIVRFLIDEKILEEEKTLFKSDDKKYNCKEAS